MGFWRVVGRMIAGKPAFEVPDEAIKSDETVAEPVMSPAPTNGRIDHGRRLDESGRKIIPEVQILRSEYRISGNFLTVSAHIRNNSNIQVELDKINAFGRLYQISRWLKPGEEHEVLVYKGNLLTSGAYHSAELYYKDCDSGDYFCARHQIEYRQDGNGVWYPYQFHLIHPIKDV